MVPKFNWSWCRSPELVSEVTSFAKIGCLSWFGNQMVTTLTVSLILPPINHQAMEINFIENVLKDRLAICMMLTVYFNGLLWNSNFCSIAVLKILKFWFGLEWGNRITRWLLVKKSNRLMIRWSVLNSSGSNSNFEF